MPLNQRAAMRWLIDLDLLFVTGRFEIAFDSVPCGVETVFAAEFEEGKNGESTPMSPWNHIQSVALTDCVSAIAASNEMSVAFIVAILRLSASPDVFLMAPLVYRRNNAVHRSRL